MSQVLLMLKPLGMEHRDEIKAMIERTCENTGLVLVANFDVELTLAQAREFYAEHLGKWFYEQMGMQISSRVLWGCIIEGKYAPWIMRRLLGPTNPMEAHFKAPGSIRGLFAGRDDMKERAEHGKIVDNAAHGSRNWRDAKREIAIVRPEFGSLFQA